MTPQSSQSYRRETIRRKQTRYMYELKWPHPAHGRGKTGRLRSPHLMVSTFPMKDEVKSSAECDWGEEEREKIWAREKKYKTVISEKGAGSLQRRVARWPGSIGNAPKVWDQEFKRNSVCSVVVSSNEAQRLRRGQNKAHSWVHWGSGSQPQMNVTTTRELLKKYWFLGSSSRDWFSSPAVGLRNG